MQNLVCKIALVLCVLAILSKNTYADNGSRPAVDWMTSVSELRLGAFWHNAEGNDTSEDGTDLNLEILFGRLPWSHSNRYIHRLLTPRPHIGMMLNSSDSTNQLYFGFTWQHPINERLYFETSFGGALHDGPLDKPGLSFGCTLNFRESASLGLKLDSRWHFLITVDHMSNANLCDRNGGLTNVGARLGYTWN